MATPAAREHLRALDAKSDNETPNAILPPDGAENPRTPRQALDIEDFLQASTDASLRTRRILVILVIAVVLAFAGLLNSLQSQWMHSRMRELGNIRGEYTESKLGPYPEGSNFKTDAAYKESVDLYRQRYLALCAAVEKEYVEIALTIHVPILGFTIDANDLGLLGGVGFIVILACYRFFLSREIDNLRISFDEAKYGGFHKLDEFYKLLAMRQVFTVPHTGYINRSIFLRATPKLLNWLPVFILAAILGNDAKTFWVGKDLGSTHYWTNVTFELLALIITFTLARSVTLRLSRMDEIWKTCWTFLEAKRANRVGDWGLVPEGPSANAIESPFKKAIFRLSGMAL